LVGNFKNAGREWQLQDEPELVDVHDFPGDAVGKAIPYGVYDVAANNGFVSVGTDLFSFISINWRGRPLRTYETVVNLIGGTTTSSGLVVRARLDRRRYPIGQRVSVQEMRALNIQPHTFRGDWNYVVRPRTQNDG
jgi:hypothetical protein